MPRTEDPVPLLLLAIAVVITLLAPAGVAADIYRFVTIDGIETFTDAPQQKDAQVVVRSSRSRSPAARPLRTTSATNPRPQASPSLREIIEKTVQNQLQPVENAKTVETVLPVTGTITSGVGMRVDPIDGAWRHHNGIDIAVPEGTPVRAVADGNVVYAGFRSGYGWTVLLEHSGGMITLYGHNSKNTVDQGQAVKKGDTIALAGSTGRSTGPHVHFEAWQSGSNITAAFMPGSGIRVASAAAPAAPSVPRTRFRREVLADGSLLISNVPASIP